MPRLPETPFHFAWACSTKLWAPVVHEARSECSHNRSSLVSSAGDGSLRGRQLDSMGLKGLWWCSSRTVGRASPTFSRYHAQSQAMTAPGSTRGHPWSI